MPTVTIDAEELKRVRLKLAIAAKANRWGISEHALEDVVARAMQSAILDTSTGELKNFDADIFLSGIAVDEKTQHLVGNGGKQKKSVNPVHGDLTPEQFNALPPEERLKRANALSFADKKRAA